jgi:hypothetical protein
MKITIMREFYDVSLNLYDIEHGSFIEALDYVRNFCGGFVWSESETTTQEKPINARYIDTFYNINVYYDFMTDAFLFEDFN